jgi:Tfp pilus assembly protein PilF
MRLILCAALAALLLAAQNSAPPSVLPARTPRETKDGQDGRVISVDLLRYPINQKARRMLQKALKAMSSGDYQAAIRELQEVLVKYPNSAPYVYSIIGVAYVKTDQLKEAVGAFEKAVMLVPHDAFNRYNLGLALVSAGDYQRGEQEVRRALAIDPKNATIRDFLNVLSLHNARAREIQKNYKTTDSITAR